jgi:hypothetical protein
VVLGLAACATLEPAGSGPPLDPAAFRGIHAHARLASAAYEDTSGIDAAVTAQGLRVVEWGVLPSVNLQYFLAASAGTGAQVVAIRGTANLDNALVDMRIQLVPDARAGVPLHRGFAQAAAAVYDQVVLLLDRGRPVDAVGHSLGGAVAVILGMYLERDGFAVGRVTTFGQPKVTDRAGAGAFAALAVTRVVVDQDVVPLVPQVDPRDLERPGVYWHVGGEVVLFPGRYYASLDGRESMQRSLTTLPGTLAARDLDTHRMATYLVRLDEKLPGPEKISYRERGRHLQ